MNVQADLHKRIKSIFAEHGRPITIEADGRCSVAPCRYFGGSRVERFRSVVQAVDRFNPIFQDERLFGLYSGV